LAKSLQQIEAEIKREVTRLHKMKFGKGPGDTVVKITGNVISIKLDKVLTPLEEAMLQLEEGKEIVERIRHELIQDRMNEHMKKLEEVTGCLIENITHILRIEQQEFYIFLVLDCDVEDRLNQAI
jgi:uncharacterized protein YbcI